MKTSHLTLFVLVMSSMLATPVSGQLGRLLKRKLERQAERAADKAISGALERAIEKKLDELFGLEGREVETRGDTIILRDVNQAMPTILLSEEPPADPEPSAFTGSFRLEVESYKKDKLEKGFPWTIDYYVDTYALALEMSGEQETALIIDRKARTMTTKMEHQGEKKAIVMPLRMYRVNQLADTPEYEVRETGQTKEIEGFSCREYVAESATEISHLWVTDAIELDMETMFNFLQVQNKQQQALSPWEGIEGVPVYTETEVKGEKIRRVSRLVDYQAGKVDPEPFSTEGYSVQEMPALFANRGAEAEEEK